MAFISADRVKETTETTGTGAITLAGASAGYRSFASVMSAADTCHYCIVGNNEWEVGLGTYDTTLARTTVIASSNAGSAVNFSAGTKDVFITLNQQTILSLAAAASHSHAISDVTGLQAALDGKQASGSYAAASHSHAISDVTGLQTALDAKLDDSQLDTDTTLAANSDTKIATQKAVKAYVDANAGDNSWTLVDQSGNPITSTTVTITIASPGVVSWTGHGLAADTAIILNTTGALPTGLTVGAIYYVRNPAANSFELSATVGGASINTTGSQSGAHSAQLAASWVWSTNVASVAFTGLAGATEIMIYAHGVAVSVSGAAMVQVSTNGGSSYYTTSGDYLAIAQTGTAANTIGSTFWSTNSTAARYGTVTILNPTVVGPKFMPSFPSDSTPLRIFVAELSNPINAIRVVGSAGGNITAGKLYVYVK